MLTISQLHRKLSFMIDDGFGAHKVCLLDWEGQRAFSINFVELNRSHNIDWDNPEERPIKTRNWIAWLYIDPSTALMGQMKTKIQELIDGKVIREGDGLLMDIWGGND